MGLALPNPRYERKFIAQGFSLPETLALVRRHPGAFRETYPARIINNIYLDSPSRAAYYDHINGASNRVKHRIRWYGALLGNVPKPTLERKFKSGSVSGKDAHVLQPFHMNGEPVAQTLAALAQDPALPDRLRTELRHLAPCLINQYRRHYFVSGDGHFRLTVDSDFHFGNANAPHAKVSGVFSGVPSVVMEVKFGIEHAARAEIITNWLPVRMSRCSKFILGVERV